MGRHTIVGMLLVALVGAPLFGQRTDPPDLNDLAQDFDLDPSESPISDAERQIADEITRRVSSAEWLGALAPVALSPFFGLTCLSGIAILGQDHLPADHFLRRPSTPLRNPLVLITFLLLTILTSIPKLSKVSKPFGQAVDQLETYSALVILLVIRFMGSMATAPPEADQVAIVYQAGFAEFSLETLLMLATVVNVIVINTVKFFFEVMIWITPIPFIDAMFETANKATCAMLAGIYAYSPTLATLINLSLLVACLLVFAWVKRREVFYRTMLFDLLRGWRDPNAELPKDVKLTVFPETSFEGIPALARCELSAEGDGWQLQRRRWFRAAEGRHWLEPAPAIERGMLINRITVGDTQFRFGRRYNRRMSELAHVLRAQFDGTNEVTRPRGNLASEMA